MNPTNSNQQPSLLDLLIIPRQQGTYTDWEAVFARLNSHPHEAATNHWSGRTPLEIALRCGSKSMPISVLHSFLRANHDAVLQGRRGWTPLFTACSADHSFDVIQTLLHENALAASQPTNQGRIPLHVARNAEVVRLLLHAFPRSVFIQDYRGKTPLHYAASRGSPFVIKELIAGGKTIQTAGGTDNGAIDGTLAWDEDGRTPLDIICSKIVHECGPEEYSYPPPAHLWESFTLLVRETFYQSKRRLVAIVNGDHFSEEPFRMLHVIVEMGCPPAVLRHELIVNPKQARERDDLGRVPLSIAASNPSHLSNKEVSEVIDILTDQEIGYPQAACMVDIDGRLPLHFISETKAQYNEGIQTIFQAAPRAIETRDVKTRLYPFMLAAVGENGCIDSTFCLLREAPAVLLGPIKNSFP